MTPRAPGTGGGTLIDGSGGEFPSDDTYETAQGHMVFVRCTLEAHRQMPDVVPSLKTLRDLKGVSSVTLRMDD